MNSLLLLTLISCAVAQPPRSPNQGPGQGPATVYRILGQGGNEDFRQYTGGKDWYNPDLDRLIGPDPARGSESDRLAKIIGTAEERKRQALIEQYAGRQAKQAHSVDGIGGAPGSGNGNGRKEADVFAEDSEEEKGEFTVVMQAARVVRSTDLSIIQECQKLVGTKGLGLNTVKSAFHSYKVIYVMCTKEAAKVLEKTLLLDTSMQRIPITGTTIAKTSDKKSELHIHVPKLNHLEDVTTEEDFIKNSLTEELGLGSREIREAIVDTYLGEIIIVGEKRAILELKSILASKRILYSSTGQPMVQIGTKVTKTTANGGHEVCRIPTNTNRRCQKAKAAKEISTSSDPGCC